MSENKRSGDTHTIQAPFGLAYDVPIEIENHEQAMSTPNDMGEFIYKSRFEEDAEKVKTESGLDDLSLTEEIRSRDEGRSGALTALLQGMSNDQSYQLAWLASKRFPEMAEQGGNPANLYFFDEDKELSYIDPSTGKANKEFKDGFFRDLVYGAARNVGPTMQLVSEMVGGTLGLTSGFGAAGPYGAALGGGGGTALGGAGMYELRSGIAAALDGPPLNVAKARNDLAVEAAFGSLPFGASKGEVGNIYKTVTGKFPESDQRFVLEEILQSQDKTAEQKMLEIKEKFDIDVSLGEVQRNMGMPGSLQRYLQQQAESQKIWDLYHDRSLQIEEIAETFFDELAKGKYKSPQLELDEINTNVGDLPSMGGTLTGKGSADPNRALAQASENVIKRLAEKREVRAARIYEKAYELPITIDVSDIGARIKKVLDNPNVKGDMRKAHKKMYDALIDETKPIKNDAGKITGYEFRSDTKLLHEALQGGFADVLSKKPKYSAPSYGATAKLDAEISERMKILNPEFARAQAVYNPTKPHLQVLENTIINDLAKVAGKGRQASRLVRAMFTDKNIPISQIRTLKRMIQATDPQAWQNIKGHWLRTQFSNVANQTSLLGRQNKFLQSIGVKSDLPRTRGGRKAVGRSEKLYKEILDPEEYDQFVDVVELMQIGSYISSQGDSATQEKSKMQGMLEKASGGKGKYVSSLLRLPFEVSQRFLIRGFDDVAKESIIFQREAFEDQLIDVMFDPNKARKLREEIEAIKPLMYVGLQSGFDVAGGVLDNLAETPDRLTDQGLERSEYGIRLQEGAEEANQLMQQEQEVDEITRLINDVQIPPVGESVLPLPPTNNFDINPALSPTILPNPQDRELAMRLQPQGIASLG